MEPYSASINAKQARAIEDTVKSREGLNLLILIQDPEICVKSEENCYNYGRNERERNQAALESYEL